MQLAKRVGPKGYVLGLDCCEGFLDFGRADVNAAGLKNVEFLDADVQTYPFKHDFDFCFSRFGTQFFENPVAALRNMRTALKPGGTMTMIVWRKIADNPWLGHAKNIVLRYLPPPGDDARSCGPGPFSMANQETVTKQLRNRRLHQDRVRADRRAGVRGRRTSTTRWTFSSRWGRPAKCIARRERQPARATTKSPQDLKTALAPYQTNEGIVMASSSWKVTARNPH